MKHYNYSLVATAVACLFVSVPVASAAVGVGATAGTEVETTVMPMRVNAGAEGSVGAEPKVTLTPAQMNALMAAQAEQEKKNGEREIEGVRMEGEGNMGALRQEEDVRMMGTLRAKEVANEQGLEGIENAELHMNLEDFEGGKSQGDTAAEVEINMHEKVHSLNEFERFIHYKAQTDKRLRSVEMKEGKVDIAYETPAKLFGFMKMTLDAHVSADVEGNVVVAYPWYHIFMKKTHSSASLQSEVARAIAGVRKGEKEGIASTTMQATITTALRIPNLFDIIANTLKGVSVKNEIEAVIAQ